MADVCNLLSIKSTMENRKKHSDYGLKLVACEELTEVNLFIL